MHISIQAPPYERSFANSRDGGRAHFGATVKYRDYAGITRARDSSPPVLVMAYS